LICSAVVFAFSSFASGQALKNYFGIYASVQWMDKKLSQEGPFQESFLTDKIYSDAHQEPNIWLKIKNSI
jgi:hypothetical protein